MVHLGAVPTVAAVPTLPNRAEPLQYPSSGRSGPSLPPVPVNALNRSELLSMLRPKTIGPVVAEEVVIRPTLQKPRWRLNGPLRENGD